MGRGPVVIVVTLKDGSEHTGEYIGAQDGYVYLASGDRVSRVEQRLIVRTSNVKAVDE